MVWKQRMLRPLLAASLALAAAGGARAERPFKTDDPYLVGLYRWETFTGVEVGSGTWSGYTDHTQVNFNVGFEYGLTEGSEVGLAMDLYEYHNPGADGIGDGSVHYKVQVAQATPSWPDQALDFRVKLPTASRRRNLGSGKLEYGLAWICGWRGERWTTTFRLGLADAVSVQETNRLEFGLATRARIAGDVLFLGELWIDSNEQRNQAARKQASAGIAWEIKPTTVFDLMLTGGLSSSVPDVGVKLGFRATM